VRFKKIKKLLQKNFNRMITKKIFQFVLILMVYAGFTLTVLAVEPVTPKITVSYSKLSDGTRRISVAISARQNDKRVNIPDAELEILAQNDEGKTPLGSVVTNQSGKASLDIAPGTTLPKDQDGYTFTVLFAGNAAMEKASQTIHITEAFLEINLTEKDTIKTITARVYKLNEKREKITVSDVPVEFDVKRLFCLYPVGNEKTDTTGSCSTDFPSTMPGDRNGKVTIVVRMPENENFGTVEVSRDINWGKVLVYEAKPIRGLGDTDAPLWMVYTLIVLLSGVWGNVIYILVQIIRINIIGKKAIRS
jgi:hypothetical protein